MTRRIYLDLDGVMADFDGSFPAVFGLDHRSLADDAMWLHINGHPSFFRDLPPMAGAVEFFRSIEHLDPIILTACPKSNYAHVATQKVEWVRTHLSAHVAVLPVLGGSSKPLFMHAKGDILIDDFRRNTEAWAAAGGHAILHRGFDGTAAALAEAIGSYTRRSAQPVEAVDENLIAAWATSVGAEVDGGDAPDHQSNYPGYGATLTFDSAQLAAFVRLAYSTRSDGSTREPVFLHGLLLVKNDAGFWLHHPNGNDYNGPFETREEATKIATLNHPRHVDGDLVDAARGLLADYEEDHGEGACDCMPEPQNAGHTCNACLVRSALAHPRPTGEVKVLTTQAILDRIEAVAHQADSACRSDDEMHLRNTLEIIADDLTAIIAAERVHAPTVEQAGEVVSTDNFGLTTEKIERLRMKSLKPDAISGDGVAQAERVGELVAWFARLAAGSANPKWTTAHAYELAYYVATQAQSRKIDIGATRNAAYIEGATISDGDRRMLERIGAIPTQPRPVGVPDGKAVAFHGLRRGVFLNEVSGLSNYPLDPQCSAGHTNCEWRSEIDSAGTVRRFCHDCNGYMPWLTEYAASAFDAAPAPAKAGGA